MKMTVVCIAGMHRSGTSMIARLLNLCGLYLGDESELLPAASDNLDGFWENRRFVQINDAILSQLNGRWDLLPSADSALEMQKQPLFLVEQARQLVSSFDDHNAWGWKDPRNSLTLPFWQNQVPNPKVVLCLRNPLEVAQSLAKRLNFSRSLSFELWYAYNQRLLSATAPEDLITTHYGTYFRNPQDELQRLLEFLGIRADRKTIETACAAAKLSLKHNSSSLEYLIAEGAPLKVVDLYAQLCSHAGPVYWHAVEDSASDIAAIGHDGSSNIEYGLLQRLIEKDPIVPVLSAHIARKEMAVQRLSTQLADEEQAAQALSARVAEQEQAARVLSAQLEEQEQAARVLSAQLEEQEQAAPALSAKLQELAEIKGSQTWRLASFFRRIRVALAPPDSRRIRVIRFLLVPLLRIGINRYVSKDLALIRSSSLYDEAWYLAQNPDIVKAGVNPARHYLLHGGFEGRDPSPDFSSKRYLDAYPDVEEARTNPLVHYLSHGKDEGRLAKPQEGPGPSGGEAKQPLALIRLSSLYDEAWYLAQNPDISKAGVNPARHYLLHGGFEGRDPSPDFSSKRYLDAYPDVEEARTNPLVHYLSRGKDEGRLAKPQAGPSRGAEGLRNRKVPKSRLTHYLDRAFSTWRHEGLASVWQKALTSLKKTDFETVRLDGSDDGVSPEVSIVMPVYNGVSMTRACLSSIYRETKNIEFEILVIDNASEDGTAELLKDMQQEHPNLKVFRMPQNMGFGPAVNIGLRHSKGEFVTILNNDTLVAPNWLDNLLSVVRADATIGIVSPVTNYVGEGPQIDEQARGLSADPAAIAEYAYGIAERAETFYEPNRLVFFCVLIRSELVDLVGYLDEGYEKGNFEDDDYCLRARVAGYRLAIARNAFVYHHGTATFKLNRISHDQWMEINRGRFYRKAGRIAVSSRPWMPSLPSRDSMTSVIVRTKDRPGLLRRALTSLANQTYQEFEVVLVNDGGEDLSSLVEVFEAHFPVTYVHHALSRGRTAALNNGLENAKGKWIACLDDDDIVYPWHLEALVQRAEHNSVHIAYGDCNRALFRASGSLFPIRLVGIPPWNYDRKELLVQNFLPIHTYIISRESLDKVGSWNGGLDRLEDYELLLRLSAFYDFFHVKKVTSEYRYYLSEDSSISREGRQGYLTALQEIYDSFPVNEPGLLSARRGVLDGLNSQIEQIGEVMARNSRGAALDDSEIRREIIRLVVGL